MWAINLFLSNVLHFQTISHLFHLDLCCQHSFVWYQLQPDIKAKNYNHRLKSMVFQVTIAIDGMVPAQPLGPMVFDGFHSVNHWWRCFSMVANHWSNDAIVTIHRSAWVQELFTWYSTVIHCCCCYQKSCIICISNIISLSLFQLCWFSQPPISNVLLYFLFFTFFHKILQ